jgi:L-iditol 2-dehydrogenase
MDADERRLQLAQELGADYVLNVQRESPEQLVAGVTQEGLGADVVYECSGAGLAAEQLLRLVRRRGRYVQIGLFGKPIAWDMDQVCFKELVVTGSNASVPSAWDRALKMLAGGIVKTTPLITDIFPITEWERAFRAFESRQGVKTLLTPVG